MRGVSHRKETSGLKKNTVTFAVCLVFAALLTAVNTYGAVGTSQVMLRDGMGYIYALLAVGALLWLFFTGKKRFRTEPGWLFTGKPEFFFFGAAVLTVSLVSLSEFLPQLGNFDPVLQGPFLMTRTAFSCLGLAAGPLLFIAGASKKTGLKGLSTAFAAIWSFAFVVSECTFFIPLPDISLYLPRLGTAVFATLTFCYLTMAGKAGLRRNAAGLRTCAGALMMFSVSDIVFWMIYHNNAFRAMPVSSFLFAIFFALYSVWFSFTLDRRFISHDPLAEVASVEL